jgi:septum formation protein
MAERLHALTSPQKHRIVLASSSPRRRDLLSQAGVPFSVRVSGVDETPIAGESPRAMVERLALLKASSVAKEEPESLVIGADTTVCVDDICLGKPEDDEDAARMLSTIQGRTHLVWGGISLVCHESGFVWKNSFSTEVTMAPMDSETIRRYVATGEPRDKAGSYAIQGIGLQFVSSIKGSYSNVVGLDVCALMSELNRLGVAKG